MLIQILEDDLPRSGLLDLRHRHPSGQVISPSGDHFPQFGFGYRSAVWAWQRDTGAISSHLLSPPLATVARVIAPYDIVL